ncbi:hypothetical protein [Kocuria turfanensis]|uniref:Cobalamin-independent methionine synthase MetE C-terminal/archaeal domain-containing protein n=1 Tax=Kocuria turfanensis TaxID=388357 RepID=A0A512I8G3_9MICC|nr:hypothetical protein [Kocuria turfanensis]GEO93992.1 hypothetical protein KTU01_01150 [Kocuria turfanensis]
MNRAPDPRRTDPDVPHVVGTALGAMPGTDVVETVTLLRGELGAPHLSFLPSLPARGPAADPVARTAAVLDELHADRQPHGLRVSGVPGKDSRAARALLAGDVNVLADVIGAESGGDDAPVKTQLLGPLTLAARLHLHAGERALKDHGARRDLRDSLASGVTAHVRAVRAAAPGREIVVQLDEPDLAQVLAGTLPTMSGYRTLRAVPAAEARTSLAAVVEACRQAGAAAVALRLPPGVDSRLAPEAGADAVQLTAPEGTARDWEPLAALVENGTELWLGLVPVPPAGAGAEALAAAVWRIWRDLGLPAGALDRVRITPREDLLALGPDGVREVLSRVTGTASALARTAAEA